MTNEELDRWLQDQSVLTKLKLQELIDKECEARVRKEAKAGMKFLGSLFGADLFLKTDDDAVFQRANTWFEKATHKNRI